MESEIELNGNRLIPPLLAYSLLSLVFIATFRIFATLPFDGLNQVVSTSSILVLTLYYLLKLVFDFSKSRITKLDMIIWIFVLVSLIAAYKGNIVFGQPYYYGIMAQRSVLLSLSGILLISLLNKGLITIKQIERTFFFLSLMLLFVCYFFFLFINPQHFKDVDFVAYSPIRGYRYSFQFALVIMLLFYSLFKISYDGQYRYGLIILLIFFYLIYFLQSRTTLVVLTVTLLIYFYRNFSLKEKIRKFFSYGSLFLILAIVMLNLGQTLLYEKYRLLYNNVLDSFIRDIPDEASSAVRFLEYKIALDYIGENPLLGNGFISNQWNGGWHGLFGYFYPVDIGLLGNIFVFGLIGTFLIYIPYYFSLKMSGQVKTNNIFFKTCEYMLLFFFLSMFFSAVNIRDLSSIMFLVSIIYYFRYYCFSENDFESSNNLASEKV